MRNFKPVVETYVQEEKHDSEGRISPRDDHYFLSRLDLTGNAPASRGFETGHRKHKRQKKLPKSAAAFAAGGFAQSVFPDLDHFDRQNYAFQFVRWETLGDVRCVVIDVSPREKAANRGFVGRIWAEDDDEERVGHQRHPQYMPLPARTRMKMRMKMAISTRPMVC